MQKKQYVYFFLPDYENPKLLAFPCVYVELKFFANQFL